LCNSTRLVIKKINEKCYRSHHFKWQTPRWKYEYIITENPYYTHRCSNTI
jgi:hypothetical protein